MQCLLRKQDRECKKHSLSFSCWWVLFPVGFKNCPLEHSPYADGLFRCFSTTKRRKLIILSELFAFFIKVCRKGDNSAAELIGYGFEQILSCIVKLESEFLAKLSAVADNALYRTLTAHILNPSGSYAELFGKLLCC